MDLLARLITFDPARRCSCEEAMEHEYFEGLRVGQEEGECKGTGVRVMLEGAGEG